MFCSAISDAQFERPAALPDLRTDDTKKLDTLYARLGLYRQTERNKLAEGRGLKWFPWMLGVDAGYQRDCNRLDSEVEELASRDVDPQAVSLLVAHSRYKACIVLDGIRTFRTCYANPTRNFWLSPKGMRWGVQFGGHSQHIEEWLGFNSNHAELSGWCHVSGNTARPIKRLTAAQKRVLDALPDIFINSSYIEPGAPETLITPFDVRPRTKYDDDGKVIY